MTADRSAARDKLERGVDVLVNEYIRLINSACPDPAADPKGYAAWHASGKSTLAHLDALMKQIRAAAPGEAADDLADLLAQARMGLGDPDQEGEGDA